MTTLSWPAFSIDPTRAEWWLETLTQEHRSPLTGAAQTQELLGARWSTRVEYHNLGEADARLAWAFIGSMRGRAGRVYVPNFGRPTPKGIGGGTPVVSGAGQTGSTLNVTGGPLTTSGWLVAGDLIGVNGTLHLLTATANTDGSGNSALAIAPPLRTSPADAATITLERPTLTCMLNSDRNGWTYEPASMGRHTFVFDLVEVF